MFAAEKSDHRLLNRIIKVGNEGRSAFHPFIPEEPPTAHQNSYRNELTANFRISCGNSLPEAHQNNRKDEISSMLNYNNRFFSGLITSSLPQQTTLLQLPSSHHVYS